MRINAPDIPMNSHNMMKSAAVRAALIACILCALPGIRESAAYASNGASVSIGGGYTRIGGYYSDRFLGAPGFGLRFIPMESDFLYPDLSLSFASYRLDGSRGSQLSVSGVDTGIQGFRRFGSFTPFAGASLGLRYFHFSGERTGETINTLKPSCGLRCGVTAALNDRLHAELRGDYTLSVLSGERFVSYGVSLGVAYRIGVEDRAVPTVQPAAPDFYGEGLAALRSGQAKKSRGFLSQVPLNDPLYHDAQKLIREIDECEKAFTEGEALIAENRKIEAIAPMEKAAVRLPDAVKILQSLRNELRQEIGQLEKNGIAAYEAKEYARCMSIMQKVLAIDPSNMTARTYYDRAKKREAAIRKLR